MKMKKLTNVGIIMLLLNIITLLIVKLPKMLLMVIEVTPYVDPIPSMNLYLIMVLSVVLFILSISTLKLSIVVSNL